MIKFSLPGYWIKYRLNMILLNIYQNERNKFYDDIIIDSFFDSFPCVWNGGRVTEGFTNLKNIEATVAPYRDMGIGLRHTFTNSFITEESLKDQLGNVICQLTESPLNGINCNSDLMANYIKEKYPQFYLIWSTTLGITDIDKINELSQDRLLVLDYELNNNFEVLSQLKNSYNIEILVGESCIDNCPNRQNHYMTISKQQKYLSPGGFECPNNCDGNWDYYNYIPKRNHYISIDDIREKYVPLGFTQFKISGRKDSDINNIERYVNYLIKPEYKDEIRNRMLLTLFG